MTSFENAFAVLIGHEGGFVDHPADPGGATMYGITERVARAWGYAGPMRDLPLETAKAIAKKEYWDKYQCDQFDPRIGFEVFDTAYNGGKPVQWLQQAVGAKPDGIVGAQTVAAVRAADPLRTIMRFNAKRIRYYTSLGTFKTFGAGWANRVATNLEKAAA